MCVDNTLPQRLVTAPDVLENALVVARINAAVTLVTSLVNPADKDARDIGIKYLKMQLRTERDALAAVVDPSAVEGGERTPSEAMSAVASVVDPSRLEK